MCGSPLSDVGYELTQMKPCGARLDPEVVEREAGLVVDELRADRLVGVVEVDRRDGEAVDLRSLAKRAEVGRDLDRRRQRGRARDQAEAARG